MLREPILKPLVFEIDWNGDELIVGKGEDFGVNLSNSASIVDQFPLIFSLKLQANLYTPRPLRCNLPLLIQSKSMFSLEINSQTFGVAESPNRFVNFDYLPIRLVIVFSQDKARHGNFS